MKKLFTLTSLVLMVSLASLANSRHPLKMNAENFRNYFQQVQKMNRRSSLKSAEVTKLRLDSVVSENGARSVYVYDSHGNTVVEETYSRESSSDPWIGEDKYENSYDATGRLVEYIASDWDEDTNDWSREMKGEMSYGANQQLSVWIMSRWDADASKWEKQMKSEIDKYDSNGNMLKSTLYLWDASGKKWTVAGGGEATYDANGNVIVETGDFVGMKYKSEYEYDANGNLTVEIKFDWDASGSKWINSSKTEYTYYDDGKDHEEIYYEWKDDLGKFVEFDKTEYVFDADGNMVNEISTHWNDISNVWENSVKEEYVCDNSYSVSDLIIPKDCEFCANQIHKVNTVKYYSWGGKWDHGGDAVLYYSEHDMTVAKELNGEGIRVFPNPATDFVTITLQQNSNPVQFELFDIQGHKVLSREVLSNQKVSLKGLSEGFYFYNLLLESEKISGKLIKQ